MAPDSSHGRTLRCNFSNRLACWLHDAGSLARIHHEQEANSLPSFTEGVVVYLLLKLPDIA